MLNREPNPNRRAIPRLSLATACLLATASVAQAAPTVDAVVVPMKSGKEDLGGFNIYMMPIPAIFVNLDVEAEAIWEADVTTHVAYESDDVRQGAELDVTRSAPLTTGTIKVLWTVTGAINPLGLGWADIGTIPISLDTLSCAPKLAGAAYACTATSAAVPIFAAYGTPLGPYVELKLQVDFTITPEGIVTDRSFVVDDAEIASDVDLELLTAQQTETLQVPCNKPADSEVSYELAPYAYAPAVHSAQSPHIVAGLLDPLIGAVKLPAVFDEPIGFVVERDPAFVLEGDGHTSDMGGLLANDITPTIAPFATFQGQEGSPVQFSALVGSQCPIESFVWSFSNGTTSYGPNPQRTFGDDGMFNGQLGVVDTTGLSATKAFNVNIANVAPQAFAGPDTSGPWGQAIALNGQGVDPGADDNATLVYSWEFGDGTVGSGGAATAHAYTQPGVYTATLHVCDDQDCSSDSTQVTVRKRNTTVAYTGANVGIYSGSAQVAASLVDELGNALNGATVDFVLAGSSAGSAQTNAAGSASRSVTVGAVAGTYAVSTSFAGNVLYGPSAAAESFDVYTMATAISYTGALSGAPKKSAALSAKLVDVLGRPLAGKLVVWKLGTQQAQATTDANGVAATSLVLNQKNGKYTLTATYTPAPADASKWVGAATSATFSLQAK